MDQQQIGNKINELRENYKFSVFTLCLKTKLTPTTIYNITNGSTNYCVESLMLVLDALNAGLIATKDNQSFRLYSKLQLTDWANYTRERSKMNISQFADSIGVSRNIIPKYTSGESKMRINTLIKWADVTGYTISIAHTPHPDIV